MGFHWAYKPPTVNPFFSSGVWMSQGFILQYFKEMHEIKTFLKFFFVRLVVCSNWCFLLFKRAQYFGSML